MYQDSVENTHSRLEDRYKYQPQVPSRYPTVFQETQVALTRVHCFPAMFKAFIELPERVYLNLSTWPIYKKSKKDGHSLRRHVIGARNSELRTPPAYYVSVKTRHDPRLILSLPNIGRGCLAWSPKTWNHLTRRHEMAADKHVQAFVGRRQKLVQGQGRSVDMYTCLIR